MTTTTGLGPIATANQAIAAWARSRQGSTAISIGDIDDGVVTDLGVSPQVPVRIAVPGLPLLAYAQEVAGQG